MMIHHLKEDQIFYLESKFAVLTPNGWVIPDWIVYLRKTMSK